jgi:hypothetical protein
VFFQSTPTRLVPIETAADPGILLLVSPFAGPVLKSSANSLRVAEFERHPGRRKGAVKFCFD